jgi:hypothetical protein
MKQCFKTLLGMAQLNLYVGTLKKRRRSPASKNSCSQLWPISPTFYERICANSIAPKKVQTLNIRTKNLHAKLSYKKATRKMLVKLTPLGKGGIHFSPVERHLHHRLDRRLGRVEEPRRHQQRE